MLRGKGFIVELNHPIFRATCCCVRANYLSTTFVQEATAKGKFEDARTLRGDFKEVGRETVTNAEREQARGRGREGRKHLYFAYPSSPLDLT